MLKSINAEMFINRYSNVSEGPKEWSAIKTVDSSIYNWEDNSTYVKRPPFFDDLPDQPEGFKPIKDARLLLLLADSVTTDHISPAGNIKKDSPTGDYFMKNQVQQKDFNSYGARRGNHEVMMRGTFGNIKIRNEMAPGTEGGFTTLQPDGKVMSVYDAAVEYKKRGNDLVVMAGKEYGTGSSRDWAAKGTKLLGIKAVIAESFERIHRSNLIGMGVLPLQFKDGFDRKKLNITGEELITIVDIDKGIKPRDEVSCEIKYKDGTSKTIKVLCRIDTQNEVEYYKNGGILQYVLTKHVKLMRNIIVKVHPSKANLKKKDQLAYKIAEIASDKAKINKDAVEMVINRIIDNASVAIASFNRKPVTSARQMALAHPRKNGANVFGLNPKIKVDCEWAAWANGTAVRELDYHDTFLAADYSHPGDNIPGILAVAQQKGCSGMDLIKGILTGYEVQVNLVKGICLHEHKIDHIAHLGPSVAAGLGSLLKLNTETIYQSVQQALHITVSTRQSRKGEISSWKAFAPSHAGKLAIEAVDRCMRGEGAPSPIYEGEDSVIAYVLSGPGKKYTVPLPKVNESKKAILETYTKEHSAEYQSQALIDLARSLNKRIKNISDINKITIETSHHTHYVIGTGANDPQKMDPYASRETLDHSIMYIFAVASRRWCLASC